LGLLSALNFWYIQAVVMKRNLHTARSTSIGSLGILLLVALVFAGPLDRIPAHARLVVDAAGDSLSAPSATRPGHCERATVAKRHWSPVRFQHVRVKTANLCSVVAVDLFELRNILPSAPDLAAASAGHRTTGARAPPFA
jgi:hypothetical protein